MKRYLERFLIAILCTLILLPNVCYADVIVTPSTSEIMISLVFIGSMIILAVTIIISLSSILILKTTVKQTRLDDTASNEWKDNTIKESNNKIGKNEKGIYICLLIFVFLLSLLVAGYQAETSTIFGTLIVSNVVLIILSIIFRVKKHKRVSYIICLIAFLIIGILPCANFITDKKIESYNHQFLQYRKKEYGVYIYYVSDIEGLITAVINNNSKNKKEVSVIYNGSTYITQSQLEQLLSMVDTSNKYYISLKKDSNYEYITSITLILNHN